MVSPSLCRFVGVPLPPLIVADLLECIIPGLFLLSG